MQQVQVLVYRTTTTQLWHHDCSNTVQLIAHSFRLLLAPQVFKSRHLDIMNAANLTPDAAAASRVNPNNRRLEAASKTAIATKNANNKNISSCSEWQVVLVVDSNERCHSSTKSLQHEELVREIQEHFARYATTTTTTTACGGDDNSGSGAQVHCETRNLLAGDYAWVARRRKRKAREVNHNASTAATATTPKTKTNRSKQRSSETERTTEKIEDEEIEELMLDCIIERKSWSDLHVTLTKKSTRFQPLSRMDLQLRKLKATGLKHKWLLVEKQPENPSYRLSQLAAQVGRDFVQTLSKGEAYPGIVLKKTKSVIGTVQFLIDQHERMCDRLQQAYEEARASCLLQDTTVELTSDDDVPIVGDNITTDSDLIRQHASDRMVTLELFAGGGGSGTMTMAQMNDRIRTALEDSTFQYYLKLRRVDRLGNQKANSIMERFPTQDDLQRYLSAASVSAVSHRNQQSTTNKAIVKELTKQLSLVGAVLARRILEAFSALSPTHDSSLVAKKQTPSVPRPSTTAPTVVTPPPPPRVAKKASTTKKRSHAALLLSGQHEVMNSPKATKRTVLRQSDSSSDDSDANSSNEDELIRRATGKKKIAAKRSPKRAKRQLFPGASEGVARPHVSTKSNSHSNNKVTHKALQFDDSDDASSDEDDELIRRVTSSCNTCPADSDNTSSDEDDELIRRVTSSNKCPAAKKRRPTTTQSSSTSSRQVFPDASQDTTARRTSSKENGMGVTAVLLPRPPSPKPAAVGARRCLFETDTTKSLSRKESICHNQNNNMPAPSSSSSFPSRCSSTIEIIEIE